MRSIILASQSLQRKTLFAGLGMPFTCVPANLNEQAITAATQIERASLVAKAKAEKVHKDNPEAIVIAADTYVVAEERVLEKPTSILEAKEMLRWQSGRSLEALTGVCYIDTAQQVQMNKTVVTTFVFRSLSEQEVERYVATNPVLTWSAAFCPAYPEGAALVAKVGGSLTSFSHGLPIEEIIPCLEKSDVWI